MSECSLPWVRGQSCPPTALAGLDEVPGIAGALGTMCTPGNLIPAHCRGSLLTIIGTHLNSVYRAKIRFEARGVVTQATVSTRVWGHGPPALPTPPQSPGHTPSRCSASPCPQECESPLAPDRLLCRSPAFPLETKVEVVLGNLSVLLDGAHGRWLFRIRYYSRPKLYPLKEGGRFRLKPGDDEVAVKVRGAVG